MEEPHLELPSLRKLAERPDPSGHEPGTIPDGATPPRPIVRVIAYNRDALIDRVIESLDELPGIIDAHAVTWIDVDQIHNAEAIMGLGTMLKLHRLTLEDAVTQHQRPKIEDYGEYLFIVTRIPHRRSEAGRIGAGIETEQNSMCLGRRFVVTFQQRDRPGDCFGPVRDRLAHGTSRMRELGADALVYALLDVTIDAYFPFLEELGERLDRLEEAVLASPGEALAQKIHLAKRDLIAIRRATWPLREAMAQVLREATPLISPGTRVYLRDCYDHAVQIIDLVETYRELGSGLMDVYLSTVSNRMNDAMRMLTTIATIFIPLTFIVGIYGMNFDTSSPLNMPELRWSFGYPAVMLLNLGIAVVMLVAFWRRGWIGPRRARLAREAAAVRAQRRDHRPSKRKGVTRNVKAP